jgi:hypothetical protein
MSNSFSYSAIFLEQAAARTMDTSRETRTELLSDQGYAPKTIMLRGSMKPCVSQKQKQKQKQK